ncbi:MAG: 5'-nucleotidase C-terminal domain-containing protein [Pseudomonadota bacterium]
MLRWLVKGLVVLVAFPGVVGATTLTILHNNDGESRLLAQAGAEGVGSLPAFVAALRAARAVAGQTSDAVITVSSGDNVLPGPVFQAALDRAAADGEHYFDARALSLIGYDAIGIGNHDFDFGPAFLAEFVPQVTRGDDGAPVPYLSANLAFDEASPLGPLAATERIVPSAVIEVGDVRVGIVGGVTEDLPRISSPGEGIEVLPLVASLQAEIDRVQAAGIDKIVVISHAQSLRFDLETIIPQLSGVDVYVAGGGDELLTVASRLDAEGNDPFGQESFGTYPQRTSGADGRPVVVVTTPGEYKYVGMLTVEFDDTGEVVGATGGVLLTDPAVFGVADDAEMLLAEVEEAVEVFAAKPIGVSEVPLNGERQDVRTRQTNLGSLVADALGAQVRAELGDLVTNPLVAFQNGGGIRNNNRLLEDASIDAPLTFSELQAFDAVPFPNFAALIPAMDTASLRDTLEHGLSGIEETRGQFLQVSGLTFRAELDRPVGERVREVALADGTELVVDGEIVTEMLVDVATVDFLAKGGDGFDTFAERSFHRGTASQQQALARFVRDDLGGRITEALYPEGATDRIMIQE